MCEGRDGLQIDKVRCPVVHLRWRRQRCETGDKVQFEKQGGQILLEYVFIDEEVGGEAPLEFVVMVQQQQ